MKERTNITFEDRIEVYKKLLEKGSILSRSQKNWLSRQRIAYNAEPRKISNEHIALLDQLIPLLGYDWRQGRNHVQKLRKEKIIEIRELLQQGKPLKGSIKAWLEQQEIQYNKDPSKYDAHFIGELDSLNNLLGYNWKKRYRKREVLAAKMILKLSSALKSRRKVPNEVKQWVHQQRALYKNHPETYSKDNKKQLDNLIPLLGYDWKDPMKASDQSFSEHIRNIKKVLEAKEELSTMDKQWIGVYRRKYIKQPISITDDQLSLLNQLTPLLGRPWYIGERSPKERKDFLTYITEIKKQNETYDNLSGAQKKWLRVERKRYLENKETYPTEKIIALDSLNPIIGRDWKKYITKQKKPKTFDKRVRDIRKKLSLQIKLEKREIHWLYDQRKRVQRGELSNEKIQALDKLSPLLGYDWKVKQQQYNSHKTFDQHISDIRNILGSGKELSRTQREFLRMQRIYYVRNPDAFPVYKYQCLNKLNPLLKRDWKIKKIERKEVLSFEESLVKVRSSLISGKQLSKKQKKWLIRQRSLYRNNKPILTKEKIAALDSLNLLLGYDWKTYSEER